MVSGNSDSNFCGCIYTSMPSVESAVYVRPVFTDSDSTPPCPKNHGLSTNTTSWPASGEYVLQPTIQIANRIRGNKLLWFMVPLSLVLLITFPSLMPE